MHNFSEPAIMVRTSARNMNAVWLLALIASAAQGANLATAPVARTGGDSIVVFEGVVEAVRQTVIGAQVSGRVTALHVKAGDVVRAGQLLARIDETAAAQQAAASRAQVAAAQAQLDAAKKDYERSRSLFAQAYISAAAVERVEAQFKSTSAQAQALLAQAGAAATQTQFHFIRAPYAGRVSSVDIELGDMAMPGKPLITLYDPSSLRVVVHLPEATAALLRTDAPARIALPNSPTAMRWQSAQRITILPAADAASHTVEVRIALPQNLSGIVPGNFARTYLATTAVSAALLVPSRAVIKRSELAAVYVVDVQGRAQLRQVRLGHVAGEKIEVLAGLQYGEAVALDPLAAANVR